MTFCKIDIDKRLWCKINKNGPNGCWIWTACRNAKGYGRFSDENGRITLAHRFVYEFVKEKIPLGMHLDHVCHNPSCVNPNHLRICTNQQNKFNTPWNKSNTSGFKGVVWNKRDKRWVAQIGVNRKTIFIGSFQTPELAHNAYCHAARMLHGEFAYSQEALG